MWGWAVFALIFLLAWACGMWWEFILVTKGLMRLHLTSKVEFHHQNTPELI